MLPETLGETPDIKSERVAINVQIAIGVLRNFGHSISGNNSGSNSGNDLDGRS